MIMIKSTTKQTELCFECSEVESNSICQECRKVYCKQCFSFAHKAKIMRLHKLISSEKCDIGIEDEKCYINTTKEGIKDLDALQAKSRLYADETIEHNHDVFSNLHSLLQTIEEEHELNIKNVFLEPMKIIEIYKKILLETSELIGNVENMNGSFESIIDTNLTVAANINTYLEINLNKLKISNKMEKPLRMLFDDTMKSHPISSSLECIIQNENMTSDEVVFENSFNGSEYNEQSNESLPLQHDNFSGAIRKSRAPANTFSMITRDLSPIYVPQFPIKTIDQHSVERFPVTSYRRSCQKQPNIKNSQIVQIISGNCLNSLNYKTKNNSSLLVCAIYNAAILSAQNILFQKDLIRYFVLNKTFLMIVLKDNKNVKFVDLISQTEPRYSIRELFLSLNAFNSKEFCFKTEENENIFNSIKKEVEKYHNISKKIVPRESFVMLKEFPAKITNIISPNEFHVINLENNVENEKLLKSLQAYYAKLDNRLPCLYKIGVYGAACFKNIWYRVQIMKKDLYKSQNLITCYFLDEGIVKDIHWNSLKMLAPMFYVWNQMAIKCSLANIEPLLINQHNYTKNVCQSFKHLVESSKEIIVQNQKEELNFFSITMTIKNKENKFNIATMLNNFQSLGSFNVENEDADKKFNLAPKAAEKITPKYDNYRVDIELLNVISPDEFYVAFKDQEEDVQKLHNAIQEYIVANEMIEKLCQRKKMAKSDLIVEKIVDWKVNDHCLIKVRATTNGRRQYYRGIVDEILTDKSECRIFLRDKGTKVTAKCIEMQQSTEKFIKSSSGAVRCKLACIYPVNKREQWTRITIDRFQNFLNNFDLFAVNQCGHKTTGFNSPLPVILWGIVEDSKAGFTTKPFRKYNNLTDILIHEGLVDFDKNSEWNEQNMISVEELRDAPWDLNGWMCENPLEHQVASVKEEEVFEPDTNESSDFKIAMNKMRIEAWISASENKNSFIGTPSYVDRNGFICINNSEEEQMLSQIKQIINDQYNNYKSPYSSQKFVVNEPCIAKWNDDLFYRGVVQNALDDDKYLVSFVDFGDHADVKSCHMFHEVIAHNIPILSNRYYVSGIEANNMYGNWAVEVLDTLHGLVVDQVCHITLDDKYYGYGSLMLPKWVKQCSILIIEKKIDVKNFMLENELAVEVEEKIHRMSTVEEVDEFDVLHPIAVNKLKMMKKNQELMDLVNSINVSESVNASTEECQQFMASQSKNSHRFVIKSAEEMQSYDLLSTKQETYESFCNRRAYKKSLLQKQPKKIEELELHTFDLMVLQCEVKCILTSTEFIVYPLIKEHMESMKRLEDLLDQVDPVKLQCVTKPILNAVYLAKFSEDEKWYRAMVLKVDDDMVNIIYVDHLNTEIINVENLRQMPINLYCFKKRGIAIKLFNVEPNEQEDDKQVKMVLAQFVEDKTLTAVVRDYDDHNIPIIELIDDDTKKLIYQDLIDNSMLTSSY